MLAGVTGPAEVRLKDELADKAVLEVNVRPLRGVAGECAHTRGGRALS